MNVRDVKLDDALSLLKIYKYYVLNTAITFEEEVPTLYEFEDRIRNITKKYPYIVVTDDNNNILGYSYANTFKERSAYRFSVELTVYLDKSVKRQGLGRLLYTELEIRLKSIGIKNMCACITCPKNDTNKFVSADSIKFHEKMGFSMVGKFINIGYKFNEWFDMVWMQKQI